MWQISLQVSIKKTGNTSWMKNKAVFLVIFSMANTFIELSEKSIISHVA